LINFTRLNRILHKKLAGISIFCSILLTFPGILHAKTLEIKTDPRVLAVVRTLHHDCDNSQVITQFNQAYKEGKAAFFEKVDPGKALPFFVRAIRLWESSKCNFIASDKLTDVANAFILASRSLLALKRDKDARNMAITGQKELDPSFFHASPLPPDVNALFNTPQRITDGVKLTIRTMKTDKKCDFFANGIGFSGHITLEPGRYTIVAKCKNNIKWAENLDLRKNIVIKIAFALSETPVEVTKAGLLKIDSSAQDRFLDALAFCGEKKDFMVSRDGISRWWSNQKGHWQPVSQVKVMSPVKHVVMPVRHQAKIRILPIALASTAVLIAGLGGTFNFLANRATSHINSGTNELNARKNYTIAAWTSYGTAAGLAVAAAVLWITRGTHYPVSATVTPRGAAFSMSF